MGEVEVHVFQFSYIVQSSCNIVYSKEKKKKAEELHRFIT